ncbi:MAG: peptidoglycan editing factor PgeF [gamma proteobacterium symbiont of Bathyaustriella thionipta]|nr:peptidoglycan editing factor PgeF [gamma proteobacterium symbiont of Bathyaustriella thionipta]MCU7951419.1 peptidoglycan editing factor PgeF [gamma proteobacterium symbiont of Bathyaustriella thionipta]MCU7953851.1 peptidoglycan editing factor PgeF [gamma proteobacterium symbiont of Bathyaustriella thionipta]MCU7956335.1 peptidoglycan editing factor PgeF [gamma proteobacterium symbiont of Bathyaustriella thionipta]MCU7966753.1 peptidoglycan editing factor PgeF [gamma proteobacterium symbion
MNHDIIIPSWNAPKNVKSLLTTRQGGFSQTPFSSFNLAEHVNDLPENVKKNRQQLLTWLPAEPVWLNQIHSDKVVNASRSIMGIDADGSYTTETDCVSVVMTADCLPVLICNQQGTVVAAVHAGWRGLLNGILEEAVEKLLSAVQCQPEDLLVWLGPAIGPEKFEVGEEVRQVFFKKSSAYHLQDKKSIEQCFIPVSNKKNKYLANIYQLAKVRLSRQGVENISGGNYCTYTEKDKFFSYRRDGITGRMASLIWLEKT